MKKARVTVKERVKDGANLQFLSKPQMSFEVKGDVPSAFKREAKRVFKEQYPDYYIIGTVSTSRDTVQIIYTAEIPPPVKPKGWIWKRPPATPQPK